MSDQVPKVGDQVIVRPSGGNYAGQVGKVVAVYDDTEWAANTCVVFSAALWGTWFRPDELAPIETEQTDE